MTLLLLKQRKLPQHARVMTENYGLFLAKFDSATVYNQEQYTCKKHCAICLIQRKALCDLSDPEKSQINGLLLVIQKKYCKIKKRVYIESFSYSLWIILYMLKGTDCMRNWFWQHVLTSYYDNPFFFHEILI